MRKSLLNKFKKAGLAVSLLAVMITANSLAGCSDKPALDTTNDMDKKFYELINNTYIVIDGVLHYGDVYSPASTYTYSDTELRYYSLADGNKIYYAGPFIATADHKKPTKELYDTECEDCISTLNNGN